jgi:hypothetical protein
MQTTLTLTLKSKPYLNRVAVLANQTRARTEVALHRQMDHLADVGAGIGRGGGRQALLDEGCGDEGR